MTFSTLGFSIDRIRKAFSRLVQSCHFTFVVSCPLLRGPTHEFRRMKMETAKSRGKSSKASASHWVSGNT